MILTKSQVDALVTALPGCTDAHKRSLLPRILREWSRIDLEGHLRRRTPKQMEATRRQTDKVANRARELARALSQVDRHGRFAIASRLLDMEAGSRADRLSYEERWDAAHRLSEEPKRLDLLAKAATKASSDFVPLPARQYTLIRYLVLLDLTAIYEWATRQRAGRRVKTDIGDDAGMTYGPFWDFAAAAWPIIFGAVRGLDNALKTWATARKRYNEFSPIIWNLQMRHPEWRIRETNRS